MSIGVKLEVTLLSYTENPEKIIATAAKTCYSPGTTATNWHKALQDDGSEEEFVQKLRDMDHWSPFEHANFTFGIDGISRACLAQLTRHRIASFSVQSQRYVTYAVEKQELFELFHFPQPIIDAKGEVLEEFNAELDNICDVYARINYLLQENGLSKTEAAENARYILPNAMKTNLVMTMNARELMHFFELRCCNRAQEEIRDLAWTMKGVLTDKFPVIFANCGPSCLTSHCKEGRMSCGKPYRKES